MQRSKLKLAMFDGGDEGGRRRRLNTHFRPEDIEFFHMYLSTADYE